MPDTQSNQLTHAHVVQLIIPTDAAHETIAELGELGLLQFKDLNPEREAFARTYASQVCVCAQTWPVNIYDRGWSTLKYSGGAIVVVV